MSVVRGMRGVGEMGICLARGGMGGEGGEWMRALGLGFTNPVKQGSVGRVFVLRCCGEWISGLDQGLCLGCIGVMSV